MVILGLHLDRPYIRLAALEQKRKGPSIRFLKSSAAGVDEDVKEFYIRGTKGDLAVSMPCIARSILLKIPSVRKIAEGLPFQLESFTQIPVGDLVYDARIEPKGSGEHEASIFFAPKDDLRSFLKQWNEAGIEPDLVTSTAESLAAFVSFRLPETSSYFLVDLGSQHWTCVWVEQGRVKKSFTIPHGIESLMEALWEDRKKVLFQKEIEGAAKQIDLLQLKQMLNPHLTEKLDKLRRCLAGVLFSFQQQAGPQPVLFTGRIDSFGRIEEFLIAKSPDLSLYRPSRPLSQEESCCAIAIGNALVLARRRPPPIQLLRGEFTPRKTWRRAGIASCVLLGASFAASLGIGATTQSKIGAKQELLAQGLRKLGEGKILKVFHESGVEEAVEQAIRWVEKNQSESPYLLQSPPVCETLSWLSAHPLLQATQQAAPMIDVFEIQYHLISYPKMGTMSDPYTARLSLEFSASTPMIARKFHDSLLQELEWVDTAEQVEWETLSDRYRTSFTIKNRTPRVH
jgi:hypothetical protein